MVDVRVVVFATACGGGGGGDGGLLSQLGTALFVGACAAPTRAAECWCSEISPSWVTRSPEAVRVTRMFQEQKIQSAAPNL